MDTTRDFPKYLLYVSPAFLTWDTEEAISVRMRIWDMRPVERRWNAAIQAGELKIAAVVVVNAFGDVFDPENGQKIAGLMDAERTKFVDLEEAFVEMMTTPQDLFHTNTTIGCIVCNARFDKAKLNKIASMARNAYARCINPVGTMADGDSIYACSVGEGGGKGDAAGDKKSCDSVRSG